MNSGKKVKEAINFVLAELEKSNNPSLIEKKIKPVIGEINSCLKEKNIQADCFLGGSLAKGTFLPLSYDADVFVRFNYNIYKEKNNELSNFLEQALSKFKPKRVHGSRDYFQFVKNKVHFEVVPILNINSIEQARNITDISPLHVLWFKNKGNKKIIDSVRLSKLFCKSAEVYGAESFINGFSGHVLDILNVYYGSFLKLIKTASTSWKKKLEAGEKIVVDVERAHKGKALFNLNKSKTTNSLIVIDPIQKERNAAAALSDEKLRKFIKYAEKFLKSPSKKFFENHPPTVDDLRKKLKDNEILILVKARPIKKFSFDVAGCKSLKINKFLERKIKESDFKLKKAIFYWSKDFKEEALNFFIVKQEKLSKEVVLKGPPIMFEKAVNNFKSKHKKTFTRGSFIFAKEIRKFRDIKKLIDVLIKDRYLKDKSKKISVEFFNKK